MQPINWHSFFFLLFSLLSCAFALSVVFSNNVVRMAFYLVLSLGSVAGLFFLAGADFVGAMQLLIYVGGTLVLLVFGVMLTAQSPFVSMKTGSNEWIASLIVGGSLLAVLVRPALTIPEWQSNTISQAKSNGNAALEPTAEPTSAPIGMALVGARVDSLDAPAEQKAGMSGYLLPFEIVSVHLLVVLIGAAYLARTKRRAVRRGAVDLENLRFTDSQIGLIDMNLLTEPVGVAHYLVVGAVLFVCGAVCMATKRNALGVLMGIELVLTGATINFVAFGSKFLRSDNVTIGLDGQVIAMFVIVLAAAEAAVALAITLNFYNNHSTVDVDRADELKG